MRTPIIQSNLRELGSAASRLNIRFGLQEFSTAQTFKKTFRRKFKNSTTGENYYLFKSSGKLTQEGKEHFIRKLREFGLEETASVSAYLEMYAKEAQGKLAIKMRKSYDKIIEGMDELRSGIKKLTDFYERFEEASSDIH